ncbi:MAG TPA: TetR/AcrR family transcriptional regulator [Mycobacteriales bacterium]|nr:TetR/AcrR family transcriptional regulator [Mycobacteriales bacterium]
MARRAVDELGGRAQRTRDLILSTAQELFLRYGYRGTRIDDITDACGISRAGFYTYFATKQDVFVALGTTTYRAINATMRGLARLPDPCPWSDLRAWVSTYFAFLDEHGAFLLSAEQGGPEDPELARRIRELHLASARRLGRELHRRRGVLGDDQALGLIVTALLDQSWSRSDGMRLPVEQDRVMDAATDLLAAYLGDGVMGT